MDDLTVQVSYLLQKLAQKGDAILEQDQQVQDRHSQAGLAKGMTENYKLVCNDDISKVSRCVTQTGHYQLNMDSTAFPNGS